MSKKVLRIALHTLGWLVIYLLPFLLEYGRLGVSILRGPGGIMHGVSTALLIAYAYFNHYVMVPKYCLPRKYLAYSGLVVACFLMVIWFPHLFHVFEEKSFTQGPRFRDDHHRGGPELVSKMSYNIILFIICTFASISIRQQKQLLEIQKEKLNAELSFLKAQINPHFLFNTLNSIYSLAINKSDETPGAIIQLSELMRYILKDSDVDMVLLEKELNYISNYVALQKRRLGDTVDIHYSAPSKTDHLKIAPLILVSFVENAFKHGVNPDQDSAISILISLKNNRVRLSVVNNKVTAVNRDETMGIGLKNVTARLERLYPTKHQLDIENSEKTFSVNLILEL